MAKIYINKNTFLLNEIAEGKIIEGHTEITKQILDFCKEWLNGKKEFQIQTSGSTGAPKLIHLDAHKMKLSAEMTIKALGLHKDDNALVCLNTDFIAGKMMLIRSMIAQMNMYIIPPTSNPLLNFNNEQHFDFAAFVPLQLETILTETPQKLLILNSMKAIIIGGAGISLRQEELFQQIKSPVYHTFGMTETLSHIALRRINGELREANYRVLNNIQIEQDERGCLVIKSPFTEYPLITNDVVEIIDEKSFKWLGRADNIINSGGIKLYPEKIEKKIEGLFNQLEFEKRFFIYGIQDETLGQKVILVIEGNKQDTEELQSKLTSILSKYEKPKEILFVSRFEETATGKVAREKTVHKLHE